MSYTEIYSIGERHCCQLGETKNAFRSAMYVWNHIAQKYFNLDCFPHFDEEMQRRVWNAGNEHPLTDAELIVLASTMDRVSVKVSDAPRLIEAFKAYSAEHPNSSIGEQAMIIESGLDSLKPDQLIAWCQTSVSSFHFLAEYNEDEDEYEYSDLSDAWDLFEQFDYLKAR
ncbi:hypothetical protein [Vibrio harveyi]|uniref:hypothetical protein n=1 Tax=Vibrio harveyi TaxID=669 RepID=UPI003CF8F6B6